MHSGKLQIFVSIRLVHERPFEVWRKTWELACAEGQRSAASEVRAQGQKQTVVIVVKDGKILASRNETLHEPGSGESAAESPHDQPTGRRGRSIAPAHSVKGYVAKLRNTLQHLTALESRDKEGIRTSSHAARRR